MSATVTIGAETFAPQQVTEYSSGRPSRNRRHPILGTDRTDYTLRPAGPRAGRLVLVFADGAEATAAREAHALAASAVLASSLHPTVNMTYVLADGGEATLDYSGDEELWRVNVDFEELVS
jgi:hypothetical protein